ncbi:hypothetical protein LTR16_002293 [Cryomyces antarcticus]|uniref:Copper acquisition factor BIM1-like domain-containing protein n=1 Tax=Cryomyces antarcticus TaxID=329879 RepID=A0ABR0M7U7_9PEZI|nr:hypothetical protein LTR39_003417 [Cryomyces antarcticus]KAK5018516.1 hypothetical protein LTR60_001467 [Cryomyces antarcticus]KAK5291144.1 hypothetical protein LTR16_002293 [Cryomyces antarcticus]
MLSVVSVVALALSWSLVAAHTVITYPGWRGNNLHANGTVEQGNLGIDYDSSNGSRSFPYGMQWMYPCGGLSTSTNRTLWPIKGGAVAIQPGWFPGHATAFFYINLGLGNQPPNMSSPMIPPFQITGPSKLNYDGTFCLPQVPLPANLTINVGDNATIQVIETAVHGAALYNCVDITFADPSEVQPVTTDTCFNSTDIGFNLIFTTTSLSAAPSSFASSTLYLAILPLLAAVVAGVWS